MKARLASAVVVLQGITTLLALPVLSSMNVDGQRTNVLIVALLLLLSPALLRRKGGYAIASIIQVLAFVASFSTIYLLILTIIFNVMWVVTLRLGTRIERERAERGQG